MKTQGRTWAPSFDEALERAKGSGKPLYVDFYNPT
jgi:hypothetical protein